MLAEYTSDRAGGWSKGFTQPDGSVDVYSWSFWVRWASSAYVGVLLCGRIPTEHGSRETTFLHCPHSYE
jgi:hypothetical protein